MVWHVLLQCMGPCSSRGRRDSGGEDDTNSSDFGDDGGDDNGGGGDCLQSAPATATATAAAPTLTAFTILSEFAILYFVGKRFEVEARLLCDAIGPTAQPPVCPCWCVV